VAAVVVSYSGCLINGLFTARWIWLHPYYRRKGILSESWPMFVDRFGDFQVELPLSEAMESFMEKVSKFPSPTRSEGVGG
jgi:hypothetical protein